MLNTMINRLWDEMQAFIDAAYCDGNETFLRNYARNQSWTDALSRLLDTETANEKRHRAGRPQDWKASFSARAGAKLILLQNFANGSEAKKMYPATIFLQWRQTAAEMCVIGQLCRGKAKISDAWRAEVRALDYAEIMSCTKVGA